MTHRLAIEFVGFARLGYRKFVRIAFSGGVSALAACATYTDQLLDTTSDGTGGRGGTASDARGADDGSRLDVGAPVPDTGRGDDGAGASDGAPVPDATRDGDETGARGADGSIPDISVADSNVPRDADASPGSGDAAREADARPPSIPDADASPPIPDARDSGPTCWGTPSTHDEDSDGVLDECDNCPTIANNNQANVGEVNAGVAADGVGDACDPRPAAAGESIFLFDAMNYTTLPSTWTVVAGTWAANGESITQTATGAGLQLDRSFPSIIGDYVVETAFTFNSLTMPNSSGSLPFRQSAAHDGWGCAVSALAPGSIFLAQVTGGTGETTPPTTPIPQPTVGPRYRLLAGGFGDTLYCMLGTSHRMSRTSSVSPSGFAGLRTSTSTATFEYLLVYLIGGTIP
jgi:hypothetical protein